MTQAPKPTALPSPNTPHAGPLDWRRLVQWLHSDGVITADEAQRITARDIDRPDILAIGDGPETDIRGAADYGLDALLVAEGVTDASEGLYVAEAQVLRAVPHARIVATVHDLAWM